MSIFKGRDLKLPALTQIYQLWLGEGEIVGGELDQFIPLYFIAEGTAPPDSRLWTQMFDAKMLSPSLATNSAEAYLENTIAPLLRAAGDLMENLVEQPGEIIIPTKETLKALIAEEEETAHKVNCLIAEFSPAPWFQYDPGGRFTLLRNDAPGPRTYAHELLKRVAADLVTVGNETELLQRCHECANLYVKTRSDQMYCSARCTSRVTTRRYRERGKSISRDAIK